MVYYQLRYKYSWSCLPSVLVIHDLTCRRPKYKYYHKWIKVKYWFGNSVKIWIIRCYLKTKVLYEQLLTKLRFMCLVNRNIFSMNSCLGASIPVPRGRIEIKSASETVCPLPDDSILPSGLTRSNYRSMGRSTSTSINIISHRDWLLDRCLFILLVAYLITVINCT